MNLVCIYRIVYMGGGKGSLRGKSSYLSVYRVRLSRPSTYFLASKPTPSVNFPGVFPAAAWEDDEMPNPLAMSLKNRDPLELRVWPGGL